jgi:5-formyltetrahydrofolate cyclo-ligase
MRYSHRGADVTESTGAVVESKAALRTQLLTARRAMPSGVRASAASRLQEALVALLTAAEPATVAGYVPFGTEPGGPDLPAVMAGALPPGGRLLLPVLRDDLGLDWAIHRVGEPVDWRSPSGQRLGIAAIGEAALVVAPALAVDRTGIRLGRGGGSYDRALALASPRARVVALLYDGELLAEPLPAEPHDRRVSAVITPSRGLVALPEC